MLLQPLTAQPNSSQQILFQKKKEFKKNDQIQKGKCTCMKTQACASQEGCQGAQDKQEVHRP